MVEWSDWRAGVEPQDAMICGVDEAGRGPLAGPVVAAAVILPEEFDATGINDSKLLSHTAREELYGYITASALSFAVAKSSPELIDDINILQATFSAMRTAIRRLKPKPGFVYVDGNMRIPKIRTPQQAVIKGDGSILPIACASILAKVERDRIMTRLHKKYPEYGFDRHKGYPTPEHRRMIARHGPSKIHRRSFTLLDPQLVLEYGDEPTRARE
jgi:ribonuclease HII